MQPENTEINQSTPYQPTPPTTSNKGKNIITLFLLIFFWPVGVILMWLWTKWPLWLKIILTFLPFVLGIALIVMAGILLAVNPSQKISAARNAKRASDISMISSAISLYHSEYSNTYPPAILNATTPLEIGSGSNKADICPFLVPYYVLTLPMDPALGKTSANTNCASYSLGYSLTYNPLTQEVTISAPKAESGAIISTTR